MSTSDYPAVLWFDLETTGLNAQEDKILEVGAFLTTSVPHCNVLCDFGSKVVRVLGLGWRHFASPEVQAMHKASGLARDLDEVFKRYWLKDIDASRH